ncbi:MAG: hypothetical protein ABIH92_03135 [Nanoarchaeota archaeon]
MKKGIGLLLLAVLVVSSFSFVLAEAVDEVDEATQAEVEDMDSSNGANMRMLQLRFEAQKRIMWMEEVIRQVEDNGEDVAELSGIVEELKIVSEDAEAVTTDDLDVAVEEFIAIKKDAKELVAEFREKASGMLTEEDKTALRLRFNEMNQAELDQLRNQVREQRRMLNAERTERMLQAMNAQDEELVGKVQSGEMTAEQVKEKLKEHYVNAGEEDKAQLRNTVRNSVNARADAVQSRVSAYVENAVAKKAERVQARAVALEQVANTYATQRAGRLTNAE